MKYTYQYDTVEKRNELINQNSDKVLIGEENISEGNFLIFSDNHEEDTKQVYYINIPQEEFEGLKIRNEIFKKQVDSISADLQAFMDFYFENGGI